MDCVCTDSESGNNIFTFDAIAGTESVLGENTTFVYMDCVYTESSGASVFSSTTCVYMDCVCTESSDANVFSSLRFVVMDCVCT